MTPDAARLEEAERLVHGDAEARGRARPLLAALEAEGAAGEVALAARALRALLAYLEGEVEEAGALARGVLAAAPPGPSTARAAGLHALGMALFVEGRAEEGLQDLQDAAAIYREIDEPLPHGRVLDSIGNLLTRRGRVAEAAPYLERSLEIKRSLGDRQGEAITLGNLGRVKMAQGDLEAAMRCFSEDLAIARELGDTRGVGIMLNHLGEVELARGDLPAAASHYGASRRADPDPLNCVHATMGLARTERDDLEVCRRRCEEARTLIDEGEVPHPETLHAWLSFVEAEALLGAGRCEEALRLLEHAATVLRERGVGPRLLDVLLRLSRVYARENRAQEALAVAEEIFALLDHYGAQERVREVEQWLSTFDRQALLTMVLRRYVPSEYVTDLLGSRKDGGRSERRLVTVLFCDVRGFTPYSEATSPEEVTRTLNAWLRLATDAVRANGGTVDKFLGDGVMALFGAFGPEQPAAAARQAVMAGAALLEAIEEFNETRSLTNRPTFRIGVGLATGEAVVGNLGSAARMDYTAIGRPVNLASRLEALTKQLAWPLVACPRTAALLGDDARTEARADVPVKGIRDGVTVHLVKAIGGRDVKP